MILPPWWGTLPTTNALLQQFGAEMEAMSSRFDTSLRVMLTASGVAVGQTPAEVVYTENKLRLLHYRPVLQRPITIPLLIVPSIINRYYVLDLLPGRSLVEYLVGQGIDVYMLDWGVPGSEDRVVTLDQYITGYLLRVVQQVRAQSGQERVALLGYSLGGTFSAIFTALYGQYVHSLVALAAPINFHDDGLLSQWASSAHFPVDLIVDTLGNMPAELMLASFNMLKPMAHIRQQMALAGRLGDTQSVQDFLALHTWIADQVPFPGEAFRKYIKECYQQNYLVQGKLVIGTQRVDLGRITCPLLTITAVRDHICPPASAAVLHDLVASTDKRVLELAGGHVGIVAGHEARTRLWPELDGWLQAHGTMQSGTAQDG